MNLFTHRQGVLEWTAEVLHGASSSLLKHHKEAHKFHQWLATSLQNAKQL